MGWIERRNQIESMDYEEVADVCMWGDRWDERTRAREVRKMKYSLITVFNDDISINS